jgi:hypothetical protein
MIYQTVVAFIHMQTLVTAGVLGVNVADIVPVVRARTE